MSLLEFLSEYDKTMLPMHMPGHKRNASLAPYLEALCAACDVTEADGLDDLHDAQGILRAGMERTAALWKSDRAFWLVNGSTCGILAGVYALLPEGGKAIVQRNSHKSVYNALALRRADAKYLLPEADEAGIFGAVEPAAVERALDENPDASLLILTSPTYEGVASDVRAICELAHARGVKVLVDEAHGAHLGFEHGFPDGAIKAGADIVVHSLHKTLPSLTQTAVLHVCEKRADLKAVARALSVFETSSPSYLLMASIEGCVSLLESRGDELFSAWSDALSCLRERVADLKNLVLASGQLPNDPSKIVVRTDKANLSGTRLADILRREHRIEVELAAARHIVAMTGMGDTRYTLSRLADALLAIDRNTAPGACAPLPSPALPVRALRPWEAEELPSESVRAEKAQGRVCAESIRAYPPGIPLVLPGEVLSREMLDLIQTYRTAGVRMNGTVGEIRVLTK